MLIDIFAPLVARFRAEYPEITIELAVANEFFALTHRDADVAVRPAAQVPDNLVGRRIGRGRYGSLCRARLHRAAAADDRPPGP